MSHERNLSEHAKTGLIKHWIDRFPMKNFKSKTILIAFLILSFLLQGCATLSLKQRGFYKIFSVYKSRIDDNPIIIIPGIIGSRLVDVKKDKILWGSLRLKQVLFSSEREGLALPIDKLPLEKNRDNIISKGIIDKYDFPVEIAEFTVYRELLDLFEKVGYKLGDIRNPQPGDNLYIFDYDWRRDNVENARQLAERIEHIKKITNKPNGKFNLVCHSMGGLIGRYYMRYGGKDVLDQYPNFKVTYESARNIKKLILIGVPNLGSMPVFKFLHEGLDLAIIRYPPYILFTMPSMYQLLPSRHISSFIDENGNEVNADLYNINDWNKFGWSIYSEKMIMFTKTYYKFKFRDSWEKEFKKFEEQRDKFVETALKRAHHFQESLNFRPNWKPTCETILFGGDTEWTLTKAILKKDTDNKWQTSFWDPRLKEKMLIPGDSMITRESMLGVTSAGITRRGWLDSPMDISFSLFVARRHENIHKDATFQDNLIHILLGN